MLETVALGAHPDSPHGESGCGGCCRHPAWHQQPELLANGANPCHAAGHVQSMAQGAGIAERQGLVAQGPGLFGLTDIERGVHLQTKSCAAKPRSFWFVRCNGELEGILWIYCSVNKFNCIIRFVKKV